MLPSIMMCPRVLSIFCDSQRQRAFEALLRVVVAEAQRLGVRFEELGLLAVAVLHQAVDDVEIQVDERRDHAGVSDVLEQDAVADAVEILVHHLRERHADHRDVAALQGGRSAARWSRR